MPMYCINLPHSQYRRENIELHNKTYGLDIKVFNGVYGAGLDISKLVQNGVLNSRVLNEAKHKIGDLGCYLSHCRVLQHIQKTHQNNGIALVLEDDFNIQEQEWKDFHNYINNIPKEWQDKWDMLYIGYNHVHGRRLNKYWTTAETTTMTGMNSGAWAYIIRISSIPKILKASLPIKHTVDRDVMLKPLIGKQLKVLFTNRKIIKHNPIFGSERRTRNQKHFIS